MISLSQCALLENDQRPVAVHAGQTMDGSRFHADVAGQAAAFKQQSQQRYALYYEAAYPFAVIFYALLHAGKQVWIAGNNRPANADRLTGEGCRLLGDWPGRQIAPETPAKMPLKLKALDLGKAQLIIYTSGSSGQPKAIAKTLLQLQREVEVLEQLWGDAVATGDRSSNGQSSTYLWPVVQTIMAAGCRPLFLQSPVPESRGHA